MKMKMKMKKNVEKKMRRKKVIMKATKRKWASQQQPERVEREEMLKQEWAVEWKEAAVWENWRECCGSEPSQSQAGSRKAKLKGLKMKPK